MLRAPARRLLSRLDAQADFSRKLPIGSHQLQQPNLDVDEFESIGRWSDGDLIIDWLPFFHVQYTALLRLPESMSYSDKMQHVNHIIEILDLQRCQDTSKSRSCPYFTGHSPLAVTACC